MSTATKKSSKAASAKKRATATHPPFIAMISECIVNSDEARTGVSRPTIKKYLEEQYKIEITAGVNTNINRAIISGEEKGTFVLPKGPSGKVKLAPKAKAEVASDTKENKPVKKAIVKKAAAPAPPVKKAKPVAKKNSTSRAKPASKPTVAKKPAPAASKRTAAVKKPVAASTKKVASTKRVPVKKPASTLKAKAVAAKPKARGSIGTTARTRKVAARKA